MLQLRRGPPDYHYLIDLRYQQHIAMSNLVRRDTLTAPRSETQNEAQNEASPTDDDVQYSQPVDLDDILDGMPSQPLADTMGGYDNDGEASLRVPEDYTRISEGYIVSSPYETNSSQDPRRPSVRRQRSEASNDDEDPIMAAIQLNDATLISSKRSPTTIAMQSANKRQRQHHDSPYSYTAVAQAIVQTVATRPTPEELVGSTVPIYTQQDTDFHLEQSSPWLDPVRSVTPFDPDFRLPTPTPSMNPYVARSDASSSALLSRAARTGKSNDPIVLDDQSRWQPDLSTVAPIFMALAKGNNAFSTNVYPFAIKKQWIIEVELDLVRPMLVYEDAASREQRLVLNRLLRGPSPIVYEPAVDVHQQSPCTVEMYVRALVVQMFNAIDASAELRNALFFGKAPTGRRNVTQWKIDHVLRTLIYIAIVTQTTDTIRKTNYFGTRKYALLPPYITYFNRYYPSQCPRVDKQIK
jgi:hypothetical protein